MSEPVVGDQNGPLIPLQVNGPEIDGKSAHSNHPNMIIEFTEQRRKKEVISIDDSEEEASLQPKAPKPKERKQPNDTRKPKKFTNRCMLCKEPGKKTSMKVCLDCRAFVHQACLEQEGESLVRYRCRKCRHKREEDPLGSKKGEKGEKGNQQKLAGKRLQKEKKREQQQKKMGQFQQRYPYYFQDEKIKFPIEDKLLFIYRQLFEFSETPKPRPTPHEVIPTPLLAELLQVENFFSTFKEELIAYGSLPLKTNKIIFFLSMVRLYDIQESYGLDVVFSSLLEILLKIYLSDIFDKNKTDNVRILNEHPFFTLLIHLNDNTELNQYVLVKGAQEILRYLATVPSMKRAFEGLSFPEELNLHGKIDLIISLIKGLSEIDEFHELVSIKSEKMQQLTKEKTELVAQLKVDQAENLSNNEKLKDMALMGVEMEQSQEGVTRLLNKQIDKHKKKINKLAFQQTKTEETIKEIRTKISQIGKAMPFLTSQIEFLGTDRNNSEYFFYIRQPNRIYVKYRSYFMDRNEYFYIYQGKEVLNEVLRSLNTKGLAERHLYDNINSLIKDEIINFNFEPLAHSNIILEQNKFRPICFEDVLTMVKEIQATFSVYLSVRQFQWAAPAVRDMFMEQFMTITDLHTLKEQIRSLQESFLFAEYSSPEAVKRADDSDEEPKGQVKEGREGRKKVPIRIWGINSEKTKKYWIEYLQECIDVVGVWLCAYIFKSNVDKYVKKKMDAYYEQQMKEARPYKPRGTRQRGRPPLNRNWEKIEKVEKKSSSVNEASLESEVVEEEKQEPEKSAYEEQEQVRRPNLRKRSAKKMNIVLSKLMQQSEAEIDVDEMDEEDSENQDVCEICGEYGDMLCCDTCPKVYHQDCLKMKDIPQGQWSCFKCLERLSNQRQTRSKVKKMGKYM